MKIILDVDELLVLQARAAGSRAAAQRSVDEAEKVLAFAKADEEKINWLVRKPHETTDPSAGAATLRELLPGGIARRRFIGDACRQDEWSPSLLVRYVHENNAVPVNVSPAQARAVRAFVEGL